jgi:hypothetical protein
MNNCSRSFLFILFNLCTIPWVYGQVNAGNNHITIANEVIRKEFTLSKTKPEGIIVSSLVDQVNSRELLSDHSRLPWFEFVINHKLVTSNDPVWQFMDMSQRTMANKGTEYTLNFRGMSPPVKGLLISVKEQLFPGSSLIREKLILRANDKNKFELNKYKNELHFIFPRYTYKGMHSPIKSKEIRIATWDGEVLDSLNNSSYDDRLFDNERYGGDHNLSQAHMFHPKMIERWLTADHSLSFKGPLGLISDKDYTFLMAYEHASQDNMVAKQPYDHLDFLHIDQELGSGDMSSAVKIIHGGYLDGEEISAAKPYESVWTATGFYSNQEQGQPEKLLHHYLLKWITEFPKTRETKFYYNTWAMQVDARQKGKNTEEVMNYDRLFKEIRYAHQLGVEIFVLDAGWEAKAGLWKPSPRLTQGLKPVYDTLKKYNMELGLWMSPLIIDPGTERYKQHKEWVIKDDSGAPVKLGNACIFDFVSGFSDLFIEDCKRLIDQGVRYFKWDAIGTYYSSCTSARHGSSSDPKEDVIARYGYLLPLYIKKAMVELMKYNPDVVIEIDLTENERALMGLATISAGKLFFVNNGASDYGDYSQYRAKSMRTVANEYNGIIPLQLFTYADYPHNTYPFMSQRYNVNSSIICGRGFWGDLSLMRPEQRSRVGKVVNKAKLVSPFLTNTMTSVVGKVGASPEIYTTVNAREAAGQVIAFSGSAINYVHSVVLNPKNFLGVINNAFELQGDILKLHFQFPAPDESREAFILPNQRSGIHIISCTSWLDTLHLNGNRLEMICGAPGKIIIDWPKSTGYPRIQGGDKLKTSITAKNNSYTIKIDVSGVNIPVIIE